jgi:hypothetical protein
VQPPNRKSVKAAVAPGAKLLAPSPPKLKGAECQLLDPIADGRRDATNAAFSVACAGN